MLKLDDMARPLPHMRDTKTMRAQRPGAKDQRSSAKDYYPGAKEAPIFGDQPCA